MYVYVCREWEYRKLNSVNHVCLCLSGAGVSLIKLCVNQVCLCLSGVGVSLIKLCVNRVCLCLSGVGVSLIKLCVNHVCSSLSGVGVLSRAGVSRVRQVVCDNTLLG